MGRMSEERKAKLESAYGDNAFKPIDESYMEKARGLSARYILFANKNNKHGYCERCCKDVEFAKTKHRDIVECPNCGTKLVAIHTWRKRNCEWNVDWYVVGELVDENTFALRYIGVNQDETYVKTIRENAREIFDFKHGWRYRFSYVSENDTMGWKVNNSYYFTEFTMQYYRRKLCCIGAESINDIRRELKGISALKYFEQLDKYYGIYTYARDNIKGLMSASLYEKMEKVGLGDIAMQDYKDYWSPLKYKRSETSLVKMLGLNKSQFNILRNNGSKTNLLFIKEKTEMPLQMLEFIVSNKAISAYRTICALNLNIYKALKYVVKNRIEAWEYKQYIDTLKRLGYTLDDSYIYPKDFRKADERVTSEYEAKLDAEKEKKLGKQSALIKEISDGLRNMPDLQEFLGGSNGLLVYIPESAKELMSEGRALHNCLSTYVDRIAEGKTLVFFVRKLNSPTAPFVAFEYCNGRVVQCRADRNESVKDDNVISFVDAFVERLRKNKVLYKAA